MESRHLFAFAWRAGALACAAALALSACGSSGSSGSSDPKSSGWRAVDVAQPAGIASPTRTHGEDCVGDFNNDGIPDLIQSKHEQHPWLLFVGRRDGTFTVDQKADFATRDRHACAVADFNGDGRLDVYMAIGAMKGKGTNTKELWIQQPDHTFRNEAASWGVADPTARGRIPVAFDVNGDGKPDLFTGAQVGVKYPSLNRLWINRGDHFELQSHDPVTNRFGNNCAASADIDGDGNIDLAVCTNTKGLMVFRNEGGKFVTDNQGFGIGTRNYRAVKFCDVNGDHRPDMIGVGGKDLLVYVNHDGRYAKPAFSERLTDGKDVACGDVNGDGHLDLFVVQGKGAHSVLLNSGNGRTYTHGPKIPAHKGVGDGAVAIPNWKGTGRAAFVVNNGYQFNPAPPQLIEFDKS